MWQVATHISHIPEVFGAGTIALGFNMLLLQGNNKYKFLDSTFGHVRVRVCCLHKGFRVKLGLSLFHLALPYL